MPSAPARAVDAQPRLKSLLRLHLDRHLIHLLLRSVWSGWAIGWGYLALRQISPSVYNSPVTVSGRHQGHGQIMPCTEARSQMTTCTLPGSSESVFTSPSPADQRDNALIKEGFASYFGYSPLASCESCHCLCGFAGTGDYQWENTVKTLSKGQKSSRRQLKPSFFCSIC